MHKLSSLPHQQITSTSHPLPLSQQAISSSMVLLKHKHGRSSLGRNVQIITRTVARRIQLLSMLLTILTCFRNSSSPWYSHPHMLQSQSQTTATTCSTISSSSKMRVRILTLASQRTRLPAISSGEVQKLKKNRIQFQPTKFKS